MRTVSKFQSKLADYFDKEEANELGYNKYKPKFNKQQFLKDCGVN